MLALRRWLEGSRWGLPYRWLRDILKVSASRRLLQRLDVDLGQRIASLEHAQAQFEVRHKQAETDVGHVRAAIDRHAEALGQLASLYRDPALPFIHKEPAPPWLGNAVRVLGPLPEGLGQAERERRFYSYYSEMAGGGQQEILLRQYDAYLPLLPRHPGHRLLDIGCGAGEFLAYLDAHDYPAIGIDREVDEIERARMRGLDVVLADALDHLRRTDERFAAISLLQVIEHIPPEHLRPLLDACVNALVPGGALLIETVNLRHPDALNGFYTDPTHERPLADNYLAFLFQWHGLEKVELIYSLPDWMAGVSAQHLSRCYLNYAVTGTRPA